MLLGVHSMHPLRLTAREVCIDREVAGAGAAEGVVLDVCCEGSLVCFIEAFVCWGVDGEWVAGGPLVQLGLRWGGG